MRFPISNFRFPIVPALGVLLGAFAAAAAEQDARPLLDRARESLAAKQYDQALQSYEDAAKVMPDSAEVAYDRGVAFYRKGDFAKAAEMFTSALSTKDRGLEAKAKFNLGNCAYATALSKKQDPKSAIEQLRLATSHYRDAIEADPKDTDGRANIELAQRLIKTLEEQQKQQEKQDQKDQQDKKDDKKPPQSQPESQPSSQPQSSDKKDQDQKSQDQKDGQKQKQQDKSGQKGEQKSGKDQQGEQKEGEQKQGSEKDAKDQQGKKLEAAQKGDQKNVDKNAQQAQMIPTTQRALTKEEAEKLLQLIRDKEHQRAVLLQQMRQKQAKQAPVEKDW